MGNKSSKRSSPVASSAEPTSEWLNPWGFKRNPFEDNDAHEEKNIPDYYVPIHDLYIENLIARTSPWLILAGVGRGKTALRKMVAASCFPADRTSKTLAIEFERDAWFKMKELAGKGIALQPVHYAQRIIAIALAHLKKRWGDTLNRYSQFSLLQREASDPADTVQAQPCLARLVELAQILGLSRVICLVDELDNVFPGDSPVQILDWVKPLLVPEVRTSLVFRYFLLDSVREPLIDWSRRLGLGTLHITSIRWQEDDLVELLAQRLRYFSEDKLTPYGSIGQLCEEQMSLWIDHDIARTAENSPRAALVLAYNLLANHCDNKEAAFLIKLPTWQDTKKQWREERALVLAAESSFGGENGFRIKDQAISLAGKDLSLKKRDYLLLRCLIEANGQVRSLDDLALAIKPDNEKEGISHRAVQEAIRRMKNRLKEQGVDTRWVQALAGRGYYLCRPGDQKQLGASLEPGSGQRLSPPVRHGQAVAPFEPKRGGPAEDPFSPLESGLRRLLRRLGRKHSQYNDALLLQSRLMENIEMTRHYGDNENNRSVRYEIIDQLNSLCSNTLSVTFHELCH